MRVEVSPTAVEVAAGGSAELVLTVANTSEVIDGVSARLLGIDGARVRSSPPELALFPDTEGTIALHLEVPPQFPAGTHAITVEVSSSVDPGAVVHRDVELVVAPSTEASLRVEPAAVTSTAAATFTVVCENTGNTPVELALTAADPERALRYEFVPPVVAAPPGGRGTAELRVKARRRLAGGELTRTIDIVGVGVGGAAAERDATAVASHTQRPLIAKGVLTSGVLAAVVAVWALAFLFAMGAILDGEAVTKTAPASFFLATVGAEQAAAGGGAASGESALGGGGNRGLDPRVVGGSISGLVTASSTGAGVGRVTVEVVRDGASGPRIVSAAATGEDGSYTVGGLFPGRYKLRFTAPGFEEVWYPSAPDRAAAEVVRVSAVAETSGVDAVVEGMPGSISGRVDTGGATTPPVVTVVVRPVSGAVATGLLATTTADASGAFSLAGIPTPGSYELSFTAPGFEPQSVLERLDGGEQLTTNTVRMSAGPGSISGVVTDGSEPLGGVTVTAVSGSTEAVSATPTSGAVGRYAFTDLPTPGTYLLTFSKEGFGAETIAVELGPGEDRTSLDIALIGGTGTVAGTVTDPSGAPLGDVTVTVRGGTTELATTTVTAGEVGTYLLRGVPTPGEYTVTFAKDGYGSETRAVELTSSGFATGVDAVLRPVLGAIRGTVTDATSGTPLAGVEVTLTDGGEPLESSTAADPPGRFALTQLPAGSYSVTFRHDGYLSRTVLVRLAPGQDAAVDVELEPVP